MKCEKATELILSSEGALCPELKDHVQKCKRCRRITEEWEALRKLKPKSREVPLTMDFTIRREAAAFNEKHLVHAAHHGNKAVFRWLSFASAAACVALFALACFSLLKGGNKPPPDEGSRIVSAIEDKPLYKRPGIAWSDIDMRNEIFELSAEIEMNIILLRIGAEKRDGEDFDKKFRLEIPQDAIT